MAQLENACKQFIESDIKIASANKKDQELKDAHALLLGKKDKFDTKAAEEIFAAYDAITKHKADVEDSQQKKTAAIATIKQYLEATDGKAITYTHQNGTIQYPRFKFSLDNNGEVVCSMDNM